MRQFRCLGWAWLVVLLVSVEAVALRAQAPAGLTIGGDVAAPLALSLTDLQAGPRKQVQVHAENGDSHLYEGTLVSDLLARAGVPFGQMGSRGVAAYVLAIGVDGYRALFAIAEVDPSFGARDLLVADRVDGRPLPEEQGPLRLIVPADRRATRSVRQLRRIEIVRIEK